MKDKRPHWRDPQPEDYSYVSEQAKRLQHTAATPPNQEFSSESPRHSLEPSRKSDLNEDENLKNHEQNFQKKVTKFALALIVLTLLLVIGAPYLFKLRSGNSASQTQSDTKLRLEKLLVSLQETSALLNQSQEAAAMAQKEAESANRLAASYAAKVRSMQSDVEENMLLRQEIDRLKKQLEECLAK